MREKQRKAELKRQGIVEEDQPAQKKEYDTSYLDQYAVAEEEAEEAGEEAKVEEVVAKERTKIWTDAISGDPMACDSFDTSEEYGKVCLQITGNMNVLHELVEI